MALDKDKLKRFHSWLEKHASLGERSTRDVVSRLRRVASMVDPLRPASDDALVYQLRSSDSFRICSPSVRSQLKKSATLYRRFSGIKN